MPAPVSKYAEQGLTIAANIAWAAFSRVNRWTAVPRTRPAWSDEVPALSRDRTRPPLGQVVLKEPAEPELLQIQGLAASGGPDRPSTRH